MSVGDEAFDGPADEAAGVERLEWIVGVDEHGMRLDKALALRAPGFSRSHVQALIELSHANVDGRAELASARKLRVGQRVSLDLAPTAQSQAFKAEPMALSIVFEDEDLLVIDKPAGLVVHPAAGHWSATLLNGVLAHHAAAFDLPRAGLVHRLDKDTSGLMVVAKNLPTMTALVRDLSARELRREYLALAHGHAPQAAFSIEGPIGRDPVSRVRMAIRTDGKPARTDVECVGVAEGDRGRISAWRCRLHTGRTHQIRVHMASQGLPLVADGIYGGTAALGMQRQALHAVHLGLVHPRRGTPMDFGRQPPPDFAMAWEQVAARYNDEPRRSVVRSNQTGSPQLRP